MQIVKSPLTIFCCLQPLYIYPPFRKACLPFNLSCEKERQQMESCWLYQDVFHRKHCSWINACAAAMLLLPIGYLLLVIHQTNPACAWRSVTVSTFSVQGPEDMCGKRGEGPGKGCGEGLNKGLGKGHGGELRRRLGAARTNCHDGTEQEGRVCREQLLGEDYRR